jgi:hypothetical protein
MAVYDDNSGSVGNLIANTLSTSITGGSMTIPVTSSVSIVPGNYYIAAEIDAAGSVIGYDGSASVTVYGTSAVYANPFPANGSSFTTLAGNPVNVWMNITCITEVDESTVSVEFSIFPNPVTSQLTIQHLGKNNSVSGFMITDMAGRIIMENERLQWFGF